MLHAVSHMYSVVLFFEPLQRLTALAQQLERLRESIFVP